MAGKGGKGGKGGRGALAATLSSLGIKNVTPAVIKAAQQFTGSKEAIAALSKPSGEETYYGNAVGRLKTDEQIAAERTSAFDRTAEIARDMGVSMPDVVSGFTSALGGAVGGLSSFAGGDPRALIDLTNAAGTVASNVTDIGRGAQGMAASVRDLIAANAASFESAAKANRDAKREELLLGMRKAQDARKTALTAARVSAQSGTLGNISTLLGLKDSYGSGSGGGYGGGSGSGGSGGAGGLTFSWDKVNPSQVAAGQAMEGLMGSSSNVSSGSGGASSSSSRGGTSAGTGARPGGNTPGYNTDYARREWAKKEAERIKKRVQQNQGGYGLMPGAPVSPSADVTRQEGDFSGMRNAFG